MNSKICNAEISQVLEKQAGAECVEEVIAAKPSVANKKLQHRIQSGAFLQKYKLGLDVIS